MDRYKDLRLRDRQGMSNLDLKIRDRGAGGAGGALAPPIIFKR